MSGLLNITEIELRLHQLEKAIGRQMMINEGLRQWLVETGGPSEESAYDFLKKACAIKLMDETPESQSGGSAGGLAKFGEYD